MALLFLSPQDDPTPWRQALSAQWPDLDFRVWPAVGDPADIEVALVWNPPPGALQRLPRLRLILSLGMGLDHLLRDTGPPPQVTVIRLVDPSLITQMAEYVCLAALQHHRHWLDYQQQQQERRWQRLPLADTGMRTVGLLGLGAIGRPTAQQLQQLGFPVLGWSRTLHALPGVKCYAGPAGLEEMLPQSQILVCLLSLTPATENILNARTLGQLPTGAYLINCARGAHLVEADLLEALEQGRLAGATLDVFRQEPLPPDHPFWSHPKVRVTPHIAGLTNPRTAAALAADLIRRWQAGETLPYPLDRTQGY